MKQLNISTKLERSLKKLNFKSSDNVYVGINLGNIFFNDLRTLFRGKKPNIEKIRSECSNIVFKTLINYFNKGNIIFPTFYYEYFKTRRYNKFTSPSSLGYFENFIIKQKKVIRSQHPIFSIAVYGKNKHSLVNPSGPFSFGVQSPFNNFLNQNVIFLNLGIKFRDTCTYRHHLEHLNGVNHRYYKAVNGKLFRGGEYVKETSYSLVRFHSLTSKKAEYKIENILKKNSKIKETNKYGFYVSKIRSSDVYNLGMKSLYKDPSFFMSKKTIVKVEKN